MGWAIPRTYVAGELMTAAIGNTHWRDNLALLKTPIDDTGKIRGIDGTYFVNTGTLTWAGTITAPAFSTASGVIAPVGSGVWQNIYYPGARGLYLVHVWLHANPYNACAIIGYNTAGIGSIVRLLYGNGAGLMGIQVDAATGAIQGLQSSGATNGFSWSVTKFA